MDSLNLITLALLILMALGVTVALVVDVKACGWADTFSQPGRFASAMVMTVGALSIAAICGAVPVQLPLLVASLWALAAAVIQTVAVRRMERGRAI